MILKVTHQSRLAMLHPSESRLKSMLTVGIGKLETREILESNGRSGIGNFTTRHQAVADIYHCVDSQIVGGQLVSQSINVDVKAFYI